MLLSCFFAASDTYCQGLQTVRPMVLVWTAECAVCCSGCFACSSMSICSVAHGRKSFLVYLHRVRTVANLSITGDTAAAARSSVKQADFGKVRAGTWTRSWGPGFLWNPKVYSTVQRSGGSRQTQQIHRTTHTDSPCQTSLSLGCKLFMEASRSLRPSQGQPCKPIHRL